MYVKTASAGGACVTLDRQSSLLLILSLVPRSLCHSMDLSQRNFGHQNYIHHPNITPRRWMLGALDTAPSIYWLEIVSSRLQIQRCVIQIGFSSAMANFPSYLNRRELTRYYRTKPKISLPDCWSPTRSIG